MDLVKLQVQSAGSVNFCSQGNSVILIHRQSKSFEAWDNVQGLTMNIACMRHFPIQKLGMGTLLPKIMTFTFRGHVLLNKVSLHSAL